MHDSRVVKHQEQDAAPTSSSTNPGSPDRALPKSAERFPDYFASAVKLDTLFSE